MFDEGINSINNYEQNTVKTSVNFILKRCNFPTHTHHTNFGYGLYTIHEMV